MTKTAVVLFNLGAPDNMEAVRPFLFNLFNDKAIIGLPQPFRWLLAKLVSKKREKPAGENYEILGGKSPLLENTKIQAEALQSALGMGYKVFICMRYWHPFSDQTAKDVQAWGAEKVILLPLYPQFSTTTTGSSIKDWDQQGLNLPTQKICCYPLNKGWIQAVADQIIAADIDYTKTRLLFSAHGLPQKIVDAGDPYQWQVEQTVAAVADLLNIPNLDYTICYQSRVGPLKWLEPSVETELERAGEQQQGVAVIPIAFVSEHSETLVELDIEYKEYAEEHNVPAYSRVPTVDASDAFIQGLVDVIKTPDQHCPKLCPKQFKTSFCRSQKMFDVD